MSRLTQGEVEELTEKIEKGRSDEAYFFREMLGIPIHPGQAKWIRKANRPKNILVPGNKWGKTTIIAGRHIHKNFYKLGTSGDPVEIAKMEYSTLVISPVSSQSQRTMQYIEQMLSSSFSWHDKSLNQRKVNNCKISWFLDRIDKGDKPAVKYINKAKTDIRSIGDDKGSKLQGSDWYYISYDEWTRSHHLEVELDSNIMPRLANYGGQLDLLGTPDRESPSIQYIAELLEDAQTDRKTYYLQTGSMYENEFVSQRKRQKIIDSIKDEEAKKQIVEGELVLSGGKMFPREVIQAIWDRTAVWTDERDLENEMIKRYTTNGGKMENFIYDLAGWVWELPPVCGGYTLGKYVIVMDWHLSEGGDETVLYVIRLDVFPYKICYYLKTKLGNPYTKHDKLRNLRLIFNTAESVVDSQGVGQQLRYDLEDICPILFDSVSLGKEKKLMLSTLKNFLHYKENGVLTGKFTSPYINSLGKQLSIYREDDRKLKQDHVMTLGVAAWYIENYNTTPEIIKDKKY